jgi:hemolysin III
MMPRMHVALGAPAQKVKPKLRGVAHLFGFVASLGATLFLAMAPAQGFQYLAGVLYGLSLCVMFGASSLYHRPTWSHAARQRLRKVDHAGIFALIAGTYTPLAVYSAHGGWSASLTVMWVGAVAGVVFVVGWSHAHRGLRAAVYVFLGLWATPMVVGLSGAIGSMLTAVLLAGSFVYIVGAVVYARRWPNPRPAIFGYHEVFHVMVIAAAALHFSVVLALQYRS